ncbi:basic helix-loop-helix protein [Mortierella sp. NVP85]|nr:basic helix-loop-helix protein [Mortierella sp. NVP85]
MATDKDVQEVIDTLTNITGAANDKAFAETFSAAIAEHGAVAAAVAAATESSASADPSGSESTHLTEQQQRDHEQLRRIAEQHRLKLEEEDKRKLVEQDSKGEQAASVSQEEQHRQVLQHIVTAATEASSTLATVPIDSSVSQIPPAKPIPGSEEWHKMRRDNHKEVERRRRETINEGINDIAKMVPNSDKNKGSILRQAVKYIQMIVAENERMQADSDALVTAKFELDKAILEKNVAEATYQTINVQYEQLKRDYEELRKKMDELGDEQAVKKQRID